jgi:hypothetical protein
MKKFIASLIVLAAVNSCVAMNKSCRSHKNNPVITSKEIIKTSSKENIRIKLQNAGLSFFCNESKIDEKLGDQSIEPVTIVGYVNGYLKDLGYGNNSILQPTIIKIIINNDEVVYNRLMKTGWINKDIY